MPSSAPEPNLFLHFTRGFEELKVPYMVTGSIAAILFGVMRLTNDVDLIAVLDLASARRLPTLFSSKEFYCPPWEVIAVEMARDRRGHFNLIHMESGFKADVYLKGNDPLHDWGLGRAQSIEVAGERVRVAPPEYVIIRKLEFFREGGSQKHLRDIKAMLATISIQGAEIGQMIEERGLTREWERVNALAD